MRALLTFLFSISIITATQVTIATQADVDKEINKYSKAFASDDFALHRHTMAKLEWAGLSSPVIFDYIADKLRAAKNSSNKIEIEQASWYAKGLAFSGNANYRSLMVDVSENASSPKLRKYTKKSLARLDKYIQWNPVISNNFSAAPTGKLEEQRIKNMLSASNLELVRLAAKRVYHAHSSDFSLVSEAAKRVEREMANQHEEGIQIDTLSWLLKAIGNSGNPEYKELLTNVSKTAKVSKVRKYAKKALRNY